MIKRFGKVTTRAAAFSLATVVALSGSFVNYNGLTGKVTKNAQQITAEAATVENTKDFSWDNATVYFLLTDRFKNGDTSNDNAYGRKDLSKNFSDQRATFHGGDFAGITQMIEEGYFDDLGVNAIWLSAPYEQIHGYIQGGKDGGKGYYHQSYHGYYVADYTESDEAFGTKEEFKTLVTKAHEHGIRVVMDIVMNHAGYSSIGDMKEFGYGTLKAGWDTFYNGSNPESDYDNYHDKYIDYKSSEADWANWWGTDWIRSGLPGYSEDGGGSPLTQSLSGLPDFRTESTKTVGIPKYLENKWKKEGTYAEKVAKYGSSGTVRSYLCKWLSEWVETYGVDGFRCDTAKHVEFASWKALKDSCVSALKKWRQNNPNEPGANWTDDFWMVGEAWDHGVGKDGYYTEGGFDSMINFSTCGGGSLSSGQLEGTYSGYATQINSDPTFNALSFMSSHDEMVMGGVKSSSDMIYYGTAFLMLPGGVQIYYGDETHRGLVPGVSQDGYGGAGHSLRSDMNWDSIDEDVLAHWQKVGSFRNNHLAIGAGQHKQLSASPYTFSRVYNDDKVVVAMPSSEGTHDITVAGVFEDGTMVTDAYTGEAYQVVDGKVSVTCDNNKTILLEGGGVLKPSLNVSGAKTFSTEKATVKLSASLATETYYSVNGGDKKKFENGDTIEIGSGAAYGEVFNIELTGKAEDGSVLTKTAKFTKCAEPKVSDGAFRVKVKKSEFSTAPNIYAWQDVDGVANKLNGDWPGKPMVDDGEYWSFEKLDTPGEVGFILCNGSVKLTGDVTAEGSNVYTNGKLEPIQVGEPARVTCKYVDESGKDLTGGLDIYRVGLAGTDYEVSARDIKGYTLKSVDGELTGKFVQAGSTVTFTYKLNGGQDETSSSTEKPTEPPTEPPTDKPTEPPTEKPTEKPTEPPTEKPTDPSTDDLKASVRASVSSAVVGNRVTLSATAIGGEGEYSYSYIIYNKTSNEWFRLTNNIPTTSFTWTAGSAGERQFFVEVTDSTGKTVRSEAADVSVKSSTENWSVVGKTNTFSISKGESITLSADVESNVASAYKYSYIVYNKATKEWARVADKIDKNSLVWTAATGGDRVFYIDVTDASGKTVRSNAINISVNTTYVPMTVSAKSDISTAKVGDKVKITATATGGSEACKYSYIIFNKKTGEWFRLANRIDSNTFTWEVPFGGDRVIYVDVTDGDGQTVRADGVKISVS